MSPAAPPSDTRGGTCPASEPPAHAASADPAPAGASAWPGFQHDARHTSTSPVTGPQSGTIRWTRKLEGNVTPGAAVGADGTIYAASNAGVLHALDPESGADRWTFDGGGRYGGDLSTAPLVLIDGTIIWPGPRSMLFALDASGRLRWTYKLDSFVTAPVLIRRDSLVVADMSGTLHVLDFDDGGAHERWRHDLSGPSYGSPAIGDDGTIYATGGNRIVAFRDAGDRGEVLWHFDIASGTEVAPAVSRDGVAIFGTNDDFEYAIDSRGKERWRYARNSLSYSSPAVTDDGLVYFGDHKGYMNVVDLEKGCLVARYQSDGEVWTAPAIDARGDVYFGTKGGHILGFQFNGTRLFDIDSGALVDSYPAIAADGTLIIGSASGTLYAIKG